MSSPDIRRGKAIETIHNIQNGEWNRHIPFCPKGELAKKLWEDATFSYGMEYGAIVALMQIFDIDKDEL